MGIFPKKDHENNGFFREYPHKPYGNIYSIVQCDKSALLMSRLWRRTYVRKKMSAALIIKVLDLDHPLDLAVIRFFHAKTQRRILDASQSNKEMIYH